jgi:hypothetical protein
VIVAPAHPRQRVQFIHLCSRSTVALLKEFDETRILLKPYSEDDLVTKINGARS